jgi:hypothetical protein
MLSDTGYNIRFKTNSGKAWKYLFAKTGVFTYKSDVRWHSFENLSHLQDRR